MARVEFVTPNHERKYPEHGTNDHPFMYDPQTDIVHIGPLDYYHIDAFKDPDLDDLDMYDKAYGRVSPNGTGYWSYGSGRRSPTALEDIAKAFGQQARQPEWESDDVWDRISNILDPIHDTLSPVVWDYPGDPRPKLKEQHRKWIVREIMALAAKFEPNPEVWLTLVLTGSLTTYQYSDTSDVDVSLFVDPFKLPDWDRAKLIGMMIDNMDGTKLPGTPYEMQAFVVPKNVSTADLYQHGLRSGYDLLKTQWLVPPDRSRVRDVQREQNADYVYALESADKMERLLRYEPEKAVKFWHQIHQRRRRDQRAGKGDFSQANIVYKFLANRGLFPQISEVSGEYIANTQVPLGWPWRPGTPVRHRLLGTPGVIRDIDPENMRAYVEFKGQHDSFGDWKDAHQLEFVG